MVSGITTAAICIVTAVIVLKIIIWLFGLFVGLVGGAIGGLSAMKSNRSTYK